MNIKSEIIAYFINKLNTGIDLSSILNEDGTTKYAANPFIPVEFKENDNGQMVKLPISDIISEQTDVDKDILYVGFKGANLRREIILPVGTNPLEAWGNTVTLSFIPSIDDVDKFKELFDKLQTFQIDHLFSNIELITFQGVQRQIELSSPNIIDEQGSITLLQSKDRKQITISVVTNIVNKDAVKGSQKQYKIDSALIQALGKGYNLTKTVVDITDGQSNDTKFAIDVGTENITLTVAVDFASPFFVKVFDELQTSNYTKIYTIEQIYNLSDGTTQSLPVSNYHLESYVESTSDKGVILATLKFRGA